MKINVKRHFGSWLAWVFLYVGNCPSEPGLASGRLEGRDGVNDETGQTGCPFGAGAEIRLLHRKIRDGLSFSYPCSTPHLLVVGLQFKLQHFCPSLAHGIGIPGP